MEIFPADPLEPLAPASVETSLLRLTDGRALAYAELGDRCGAPLLLLHGTPGSRVTAALLHDSAAAAGVRLVAVDRPGYGRSDPLPGMTFLSYAADVGQLLDALRLSRVTLAAVSGGGGYALGCAHRIPDRLHSVVLVSAMIPLPARLRRGLPHELRMGLRISRRAPRLSAALLARTLARRRDPAAPGMPAADRRVLLRSEVQAVLVDETLRELGRQGVRSVVQDLRLYAVDCGLLRPGPTIPVHVLHGRDDHTVPLWVAEYACREIRTARLRVLDDAGHLALVEHPEALHALVAR